MNRLVCLYFESHLKIITTIKIMATFNVPSREEVSELNQGIFDNLKQAVGFVPNLYATMAHSETALGNYL